MHMITFFIEKFKAGMPATQLVKGQCHYDYLSLANDMTRKIF